MNTTDLLEGLDAVDIDRADDVAHEQTQEAFSDDGSEAARQAAAQSLSDREFFFEIYTQFCGVMEDLGADPPSKSKQRRTATVAAEWAERKGIDWAEVLGYGGVLAVTLAGDWAKNLRGPFRRVIKKATNANQNQNGPTLET